MARTFDMCYDDDDDNNDNKKSNNNNSNQNFLGLPCVCPVARHHDPHL